MDLIKNGVSLNSLRFQEMTRRSKPWPKEQPGADKLD
jgi:hypothetical protein